MFSSVRNIIISSVMALLLIGSSVAAATGFEAFSFSSSEPSLDDSSSVTSSVDSLDDVSRSDSSDNSPDDVSGSDDSSNGLSSSRSSSSSESDGSSSSDDSTSGSDSSSSSSSLVDDGALTDPVTYDVDIVGTVTVAQGTNLLHVTDTQLAKAAADAGWSVVIERADAIEVEVSFRGLNHDDRVDFKAELEHGEVRIRVRDRRLEAKSVGSSNSGSSNSSDNSGSNSSGSNNSGSSSDDQSTSETTQSSSAVDETRTEIGVGGWVKVTRTGSELSLFMAAPTSADWSMDVRDSGPSRVDVRFEKGNSETHIRFEISGGTVTVKVEERP